MVPGMGTIQGFCAMSQARANWAGVQPFSAAYCRTRATMAWLAPRASGLRNLGMEARTSLAENWVSWDRVPVRYPLPRGEKQTRPIPNSSKVGIRSRWASRYQREYSFCTAVRGRTAWALWMVCRETSLNPQWSTFPSCISCATVSATVSTGDVGVGPVLVEQVDVVCPQPFQGTLYGFADGGRAAVQPNGLAVLDGKAKFRGNDYLVPDPLQGLSENLFAGIGAVDLGGVEKGGPLVHRLSVKRIMSSCLGWGDRQRPYPCSRGPHCARPGGGRVPVAWFFMVSHLRGYCACFPLF